MQGILKILSMALLTALLAACSINDSDSGSMGGGNGGGGTDEPDDPVAKCGTDESDGEISVSGRVTYDRVPAHPDNTGLDYAATFEMPVRHAEILAVCGTDELASSVTDANGNYTLNGIPNKSDFRIRVRAALVNYDFTVVDNTSDDAAYVLDSKLQNSETGFTLDLNAGSGWTGSSYGDPRAAAPFAILDSVLVAAEKIESVDPGVSFPPLQLNWSPENKSTGNNPAIGEIGTTYYQRTSAGSEIFILGEADNDTDEYDDHVIIHEWGHYLEDRLSRSDSIGGPHSSGDRLDLRVAYGEGFGNAWSGIATDDPVYFDTNGVNQQNGFFFNVETTEDPDSDGWYSETSVQRLLWDIYDTSNALGDPDAVADDRGLGLAPMYDIWINEQRTTDAMTSVYSFAWALHADSAAAEQSWIEDLLTQAQNIQGDDIWGTNENNTPDTEGSFDDSLPVYHLMDIAAGGPYDDACSDKEFGEYNKTTNRQLYRVQTPLLTDTYRIAVNRASGFTRITDPDFVVYRNGEPQPLSCNAGTGQTCGQTEIDNQEVADVQLQGGSTYVLEIYDYNNVDGTDGMAGTQNEDGRVCFDVTINPAP